jgi:hypothetical protein
MTRSNISSVLSPSGSAKLNEIGREEDKSGDQNSSSDAFREGGTGVLDKVADGSGGSFVCVDPGPDGMPSGDAGVKNATKETMVGGVAPVGARVFGAPLDSLTENAGGRFAIGPTAGVLTDPRGSPLGSEGATPPAIADWVGKLGGLTPDNASATNAADAVPWSLTERETFVAWQGTHGGNEAPSGRSVDSGLTQLVQAMATYPAHNLGFGPTQTSQTPNDSTLQSAVAASWHS